MFSCDDEMRHLLHHHITEANMLMEKAPLTGATVKISANFGELKKVVENTVQSAEKVLDSTECTCHTCYTSLDEVCANLDKIREKNAHVFDDRIATPITMKFHCSVDNCIAIAQDLFKSALP